MNIDDISMKVVRALDNVPPNDAVGGAFAAVAKIAAIYAKDEEAWFEFMQGASKAFDLIITHEIYENLRAIIEGRPEQKVS